jgi:hypothetical protein
MTEQFRDNEDRQRFELTIEGVVAFVSYEVPPELGGRGVGSKLGRATLDAVRAQGRQLTVECDFIRAFMSKHPEDNDLLAPGQDTRAAST